MDKKIIQCRYFDGNKRSERVLDKLGFSFDGHEDSLDNDGRVIHVAYLKKR